MKNLSRGWVEFATSALVVTIGAAIVLRFGGPGLPDDAAAAGQAYDLSVGNVAPTPSGGLIAGNTLTYSLTATNNGSTTIGDATYGTAVGDAIFSSMLPAGTRFVSASGAMYCTLPPVDGTGDVTCTTALGMSGEASSTATETIVVRTCPELPCNTTLSSPADISVALCTDCCAGNQFSCDPDYGQITDPQTGLNFCDPTLCKTGALITDPVQPNNMTTESTVVKAQSDLTLTKTGLPAVVNQGGTVTYAIDVTNKGPSNSINTTVVDTLPLGVIIESIATSVGSCSGVGTNAASCMLGTLGAPKQCETTYPTSAHIVIVAKVSMGVSPGFITNTAQVTSGNCLPDPTAADATASVQTQVLLVVPTLGMLGLLGCAALLMVAGAMRLWSLRRS